MKSLAFPGFPIFLRVTISFSSAGWYAVASSEEFKAEERQIKRLNLALFLCWNGRTRGECIATFHDRQYAPCTRGEMRLPCGWFGWPTKLPAPKRGHLSPGHSGIECCRNEGVAYTNLVLSKKALCEGGISSWLSRRIDRVPAQGVYDEDPGSEERNE